jgi:hypothetical protein
LERHCCPTPHFVTPQLHKPFLQAPAEPALQDALEVHTHCDAWHEKPGGQACPHALQLAAVLVRSTSQPSAYAWLQSAKPASHDAIVQVELTHPPVPLPTVHAMPQAPQLMGSLVRSVVQPAPEHAPFPAGHVAVPQTPPTQFGVPPDAGQTWPHMPQLLTSDDSFASQPFESKPSQLS